jgi:hypothetical protein
VTRTRRRDANDFDMMGPFTAGPPPHTLEPVASRSSQDLWMRR